ncbi:MAG: FAD-dependent oxidoreductase, partial [Proteobacteria bacterium]|nr:FAD-dependent oxidoreductase [Pseudomonadota bacterium]
SSFGLFAKTPPPLKDHTAYVEFLKNRYGFSPAKIRFTDRYAMVLQGTGEEQLQTASSCNLSTPFFGKVHTVVVGGGPAGLTASVYLTDRGRKVLLLEKEEELGGLALGSSGNLAYGRGGAYVTDIERNLLRIYRHLGLGHFVENQAIPEPIDSYWWNQRYYRGLWEGSSVTHLPISFSIFKYLLEKADEEDLIPSQPIEDHAKIRETDQVSFADWVRSLPSELEKRSLLGDETAQNLLEKFFQSPDFKSPDPMRPVLKLLELYGRSALGEHPENISAAAFLNFYVSEIGVRYSSSLGSGFVSQAALRKLARRPWFHAEVKSPVRRILPLPEGVRVCFQKGNSLYRVEARHVVFAAPLKYAPRIIENLNQRDPEKERLIEELEYRNYLVMNVHVKGHPWHDSYDLWLRNDADYSKDGVTDIVEGRWFDFDGNKKPRTDDKGVLSLYNPLPGTDIISSLEETDAIQRAEKAGQQLERLINELLQKRQEPPIEILAIEINRWPSSIHLVKPGHFLKNSKILSRPIGEIYFATNNLGTPAVEEALFRGYLAARDILRK